MSIIVFRYVEYWFNDAVRESFYVWSQNVCNYCSNIKLLHCLQRRQYALPYEMMHKNLL